MERPHEREPPGQTLHPHPAVAGDFRAFLCTAPGYGTVGVRGGKPFLEVAAGTLPVNDWDTRSRPRRFGLAGISSRCPECPTKPCDEA